MQAHPPFHLRPVRIGDALDLTELERALIQDGRGMVKALEELPEDREAAEAGVWPWIEMLPWRGLRLVAEDASGQLVAEGSIRRFGPALLTHGAVLALGVHPAAQGQGLGRRVLGALLDWAAEPPHHPGTGRPAPILRIELYVRADNTRALGLYRSVGFVEEGRRRGFVQLPDGTRIDDVILALDLAA